MHTRRRGIRRPRPRYRPSEDIRHIATIPPGTPVVLYVRVSGTRQDPASQLAALRAAAAAAGLVVVGEYAVIAPAGEAMAELRQAGILAAKHGATLLAECTSRYARASTHHAAHAPGRRPGRLAIKDVCDTCGVALATVLDPDATAAEERAYQMKRGQNENGRTGGRPYKPRPGYKKRRRRLMLTKVRWMELVGFSVRQTACLLGEHPTQIQRWRDKVRAG